MQFDISSLSNISIPALKKADWGQPIFTDTEQLYFRGKETQVACNRTFSSTRIEPINIEEFLTDARLSGDYLPEDNLYSQPKPSRLQCEPYKGNVAIDQYGFDHELMMQVDNDHLLPIAKLDSFVQTQTPPQLNISPDYCCNIKNILKTPNKVTTGTRINNAKQLQKKFAKSQLKHAVKQSFDIVPPYKVEAPTVQLDRKHLKEHLDFAIANMDFTFIRREGRKSISRKALRERIERTAETIAFQAKNPDYNLDMEKFLRDNIDIMTGVIAYSQKDPEFKKALDKVMRDHTDLFSTVAVGEYRPGKATGRSLQGHLKDKEHAIAVGKPIFGQHKEIDPGLSSTCFTDDRFVTLDKLEPLTAYAVEPQPVEMPIPSNNRCRKMTSF